MQAYGISSSDLSLASSRQGIAVPASPRRLRRLAFWVGAPSVRATLLIVVIAALARAFIIAQAHGMLDGDEAVLGIQAENILHGAHPIYFSGQPYMGSWDAYLAAPLVALFGPSAALLHAVTTAESLLLIPLMGALAARLYGERVRIAAMLLTAIPPIFVATGELRMLGGYVETLALGAALLLLTVSLAERYRDGRPTGKLWLLAGLLLGLGLWIDLLIVCYIAACALWLAPILVSSIFTAHGLERRRRIQLEIGHILGCVVTTLLGAAPAVYYAIRHNLSNVTYFSTVNASFANGHPLRLGVLHYYFQIAIPRVIGAQSVPTWTPRSSLLLSVCYAFALCATIGALAYLLARVVLSAIRMARRGRSGAGERFGTDWNNLLPFLLLLAVTLLFWRSPATGGSPLFAYADAASRYALPLTAVATLEISRAIRDLPVFVSQRFGRMSDGAKVGGAPRRRLPATALLVAVVLAYALPYFALNQESVMQSPFAPGSRFPVGSSALLTYLKDQHISHVWTDHWYGNDIMYLTNQRVLCADYVDIVAWGGVNRFPNAFQSMQTADRPSFLIASPESAGEPAVARALDALHVTYTMTSFHGLWIITPTSRTLLPQEILPSLEQDHGV